MYKQNNKFKATSGGVNVSGKAMKQQQLLLLLLLQIGIKSFSV